VNYSKKVIKWIGITNRRFESEISVKNAVMARPIGVARLNAKNKLLVVLANYLM
jgi:hypothetical protein